MKIKSVFITLLFVGVTFFCTCTFAQKEEATEGTGIAMIDNAMLKLELLSIQSKVDDLAKISLSNTETLAVVEIQKAKFQSFVDTSDDAKAVEKVSEALIKVNAIVAKIEGVQVDIQTEMDKLLKEAEDLVVNR